MGIGDWVEKLIDEVMGLFGGGSHAAPAQTTSKPTANFISSPGGWTPPIHDQWASSGGFTYQPNPTHPKGHMGVDMRAPAGTPIYPMAPGIVSNVGTNHDGGNTVNVKHKGNVETYYAHMSTVKVQPGDKVTTNTVLGNVGNTGNASHTFPHLHLQVWENGAIQDPAKYFSIPKYTDLSPAEKKQGPWLSEQAKQEAMAFSMDQHLAEGRRRNKGQSRVAFSRDVNKLLKIASSFEQLTKKL